jgi:hypothetical protein
LSGQPQLLMVEGFTLFNSLAASPVRPGSNVDQSDTATA